MKNMTQKQTIFFLIIISAAVLFTDLGRYDIINVNEAQRIMPAIGMTDTGNWIVPYLDGKIYITKPILIYWILGLNFLLFGTVSEFISRVPLAFCGILSVLLTYEFGKRFFNKRIGLIGAISLLTSYYFYQISQTAELDGALILTVLLGIYAMLRAELDDKPNHRWWYISFFAWGLAFLLKWVVFLMFFIPALILLIIYSRKLKRKISWLAIFFGIILFLLIVIPWCALLIDIVGYYKVKAVLIRQGSERFIQASKINYGSPIFYLIRTPVALLPWTWLLLTFFAKGLWRDIFKKGDMVKEKFLALFCLITFIAFSLVKGKETEYLVPLHPFILLLGAIGFEYQSKQKENKSKFFINLLRFEKLCLISCGVIAALFPLTMFFEQIRLIISPSLFLSAGILIFSIMGLFFIYAVIKYPLEKIPIFFSIFCLCFYIFIVPIYKIRQNEKYSTKMMSNLAKNLASDKKPLVLFFIKKPQYQFYFHDVKTKNFRSIDNLIKWSDTQDEFLLFVTENNLEKIETKMNNYKIKTLFEQKRKEELYLLDIKTTKTLGLNKVETLAD